MSIDVSWRLTVKSPRNTEITETKLLLRLELGPSMYPVWVDVMSHPQLWPGRCANERRKKKDAIS